MKYRRGRLRRRSRFLRLLVDSLNTRMTNTDKLADLAGPGIGTYEEVAEALPSDYQSLLNPRETMEALFEVKRYIEDGLAKELNLTMVQVPLIVDETSGVNDYLDRDGSRTPVQFPAGLGLDKPIQAQVVQAATKWKRMALKTFDCQVGQGINTDMKAVRKDYFLDHDHSAYVDQWDWERVITADQRNLEFLTDVVRRIWKVLRGAQTHAEELFPQLKSDKYPSPPEELTFLHAEEILDMYLLKKAHLGEVSVTVWPKTLNEISAAKNIHVLE